MLVCVVPSTIKVKVRVSEDYETIKSRFNLSSQIKLQCNWLILLIELDRTFIMTSLKALTGRHGLIKLAEYTKRENGLILLFLIFFVSK